MVSTVKMLSNGPDSADLLSAWPVKWGPCSLQSLRGVPQVGIIF